MDYEFDAPQYFDFSKPEKYEDAYNDTWFDHHIEDDIPFEQDIEKEKNSRKARRSNQPIRVLKSVPDVAVQAQMIRPTDTNRQSIEVQADETDQLLGAVGGYSGTYAHGEPVVFKKEVKQEESSSKLSCSPKKKQRLSQEDTNTSPAANTRSQTKMLTNFCHNPVNEAISEGRSHIKPKQTVESASSSTDENSLFKSPVKMTEYAKSPRKSPRKMMKSPRKVLKSPYKASKDSPHNNTDPKRMLTKTTSMGVLNKNNTSIKRSASTVSSKKSTPDLKRSGSFSLKGKSTEEMELEKIQNMKKDLEKTKKQAQDSYKKAMKGGYMRVRSNTPATLPEGFHFQTDGRIKNPNGPVKDSKIKEFTKCLREALPSDKKQKPQGQSTTRPQPFKLTTTKSTTAIQSEKYMSAAEKVVAFHKQTPDRFRTHPRSGRPITRSGSAPKLADGSKRDPSPGLTIAKTPTLTTRGRSRPVRGMTREEKEQMEYEEHQKQQFKAHPVNHKIFDNGPIVPKVQAKPATVPEEFNLHHKRAMNDDDMRMKHEEEKHEFHAKPVNPRILKGPTGVKPVPQLPVTVPQSPAFALKNRVRIPVEVPQMEQPKVSTKTNHVPYPGVPFRPRLEHHHTVPEPFSVEERSKKMLTRKEQKIQQILDEERKAREFHAQEYKEKPDLLPPKQERLPTCPEPFHLTADERGQRYKEEFFTKQVEEEQRLAKKAAEFKAKPSHVIHKDPFQPIKSNKPLTEISEFAMNTDARAAERDAFDKHIKEKEAEIAGLRREREERIEQEHKEEIARMRQNTVHKSQGIKKYKNVVVKPSNKPLTDAHSPRFSQRTRRPDISDL